MTDEYDVPVKGAWGQAVAAVALVGALGVGLWAFGGTASSDSDHPSPATCSGGESRTTQTTSQKASGHVSGAQLCSALNRRDLAELLGTPGEIAKTAGGSAGSERYAGGKEIDTPSARLEFTTYTVSLSATYDHRPVTRFAALMRDDLPDRKVLGRPAILYSDRTIGVSFRLDGSDTKSGPGVPARTLIVAHDARDSGGSFELALWRADGGVPDDATLLGVAQKVLPAIPGWTAGAR
ncbi:hypothetical protein Stsp01_55610 [Streptomyces sp. NBRC 13847]|uniref:DUF6215 domain-containing protein n=1 Tax=Streptomyces TaxID=1883 RepID=UPI0024A3C98A|nr:DUF6215 domain-containing protein [Streptomyces sp. NBRC 13847]GLW18818.1 hypothetical protein Stsp01_55610 [Streptomyces sp. NBRC 13847]